MVDTLRASETPFATLSKGRIGPEPIGYEPIKHPIRRRLWMAWWKALEWVRFAVARAEADLDDAAYNALQRARKHDPKPIYEEGAWDEYQTMRWGQYMSLGDFASEEEE